MTSLVPKIKIHISIKFWENFENMPPVTQKKHGKKYIASYLKMQL